MITELNQRSREIFRQIVDSYVATGEPVGSRTIARRPDQSLSPASIRNVMADLEEAGLLYAPHISAGRVPTDLGFRLYVDGLLEAGNLSTDDRARIDAQCAGAGRSVEAILNDASGALSGLSHYAGVVLAPKTERPFKQVEFVPLGPGRVLVVMVSESGMVENRIIEVPMGISASALVEAGNYLTTRLAGRSLAEARQAIELDITTRRDELDALTRKVVQAGLAMWSGDQTTDDGVLIVRGQAHLLDDVTNLADLERIRTLIELMQHAHGVQIFIGAENQLFGMSGCSLVVAPYQAGEHDGAPRPSVVGAIGVIGPTRMNYARVIPMVDYTARVISHLLSGSNEKTG
jgi:heat-inducible transcriptional repressor